MSVKAEYRYLKVDNTYRRHISAASFGAAVVQRDATLTEQRLCQTLTKLLSLLSIFSYTYLSMFFLLAIFSHTYLSMGFSLLSLSLTYYCFLLPAVWLQMMTHYWKLWRGNADSFEYCFLCSGAVDQSEFVNMELPFIQTQKLRSRTKMFHSSYWIWHIHIFLMYK